MKLKFPVFILTVSFFYGCTNTSNYKKLGETTVNSVIGDISFVEKFGKAPTEETDPNLRLITHLDYVANRLENTSVEHLTQEQRKNRVVLVDLIREYSNASIFPVNTAYHNKRSPCFIDENNNICAVGYLVEQTTSRQEAENINTAFQYNYIQEMDSPQLLKWIEINGLTIEECAMIQPSYRNYPQPPHFVDQNPLYSTILMVTNVGLGIKNIKQFSEVNPNMKFSEFGLLTGGVQFLFAQDKVFKNGIVNYYRGRKTLHRKGLENSYKRGRYRKIYGGLTLSRVNSLVGLSTMVLSASNQKIHNYGVFNGVESTYGNQSIGIGSINSILFALNLYKPYSYRPSKFSSVPFYSKLFVFSGIIGGVTQTIMGINNYNQEENKNISISNIGMGSVTALLSSVNLFQIRPKKGKSEEGKEEKDEGTSSLNFFTLPSFNNGMSFGFNFNKIL